ncbi:MAG: hypothetical protein ACLSU6_04795 [Thomasclavelia ramosa]
MAKKKTSTNLADDTLVLADVITDEKPVGTNGLQHALEYIKENFVTQDEFNYKAIVINSFTNNKNTVEIGSTVTDILLSWSLNKKAKVLTLDDESLEPTDTSKQLLEQNIKTNKTWTLKAEDEKGAVSTKTTSLSFLNGIYWGASSSQDTYDNTFVLGLTKALQGSKGKVFTVNAGEGQFIFMLFLHAMVMSHLMLGALMVDFQKLLQSNLQMQVDIKKTMIFINRITQI